MTGLSRLVVVVASYLTVPGGGAETCGAKLSSAELSRAEMCSA